MQELRELAEKTIALCDENERLKLELEETEALLLAILLTNGKIQYCPDGIELRTGFRKAMAFAIKSGVGYTEHIDPPAIEPNVKGWEGLRERCPILFKDFEETAIYQAHPNAYILTNK